MIRSVNWLRKAAVLCSTILGLFALLSPFSKVLFRFLTGLPAVQLPCWADAGLISSLPSLSSPVTINTPRVVNADDKVGLGGILPSSPGAILDGLSHRDRLMDVGSSSEQ